LEEYVNKKALLQVVNLLLFLDVGVLATSALFHDLIPHYIYRFVHVGPGILLVLLLLTHLYLNWNWIYQNYFTRFKRARA
jgi:hypothetical protein